MGRLKEIGWRDFAVWVLLAGAALQVLPAFASEVVVCDPVLIVYRDDVPITLPGGDGVVYVSVDGRGQAFCIVRDDRGGSSERAVVLSSNDVAELWFAASNLVAGTPWHQSRGRSHGEVVVHMSDGAVWGRSLGQVDATPSGRTREEGSSVEMSETDGLAAMLRHHVVCAWKRSSCTGGTQSARQPASAADPAAIQWYVQCALMPPADQYVRYTNLVRDVTETLGVVLPDFGPLVKNRTCGRHGSLSEIDCVSVFRAACTNERVGPKLLDLNALVSIIDSFYTRWDGGALVDADVDSAVRPGMTLASLVRSLGVPGRTRVADSSTVGGQSLTLEYSTSDGMLFTVSVTNSVVDRCRFKIRAAPPHVNTAALWFYRHFLKDRLKSKTPMEVGLDACRTDNRRDRIELQRHATDDTSNGYPWGDCMELAVDEDGIVTLPFGDVGYVTVVSRLSREENASLWRVARETVRTVEARELGATTGWPTGVSVGKGWPSSWAFEGYEPDLLERPEVEPLVSAILSCVSNSLERLPPLDMERTRALNSERVKKVRAGGR